MGRGSNTWVSQGCCSRLMMAHIGSYSQSVHVADVLGACCSGVACSKSLEAGKDQVQLRRESRAQHESEMSRRILLASWAKLDRGMCIAKLCSGTIFYTRWQTASGSRDLGCRTEVGGKPGKSLSLDDFQQGLVLVVV